MSTFNCFLCVYKRTTHEFLFGALAELLDNARSADDSLGFVFISLCCCYLVVQHHS